MVVCPEAEILYSWGLRYLGADVRTWALRPMVTAGFRSEASPSITLIPNVGLGAVHARTGAAGASGNDETDTYGFLRFGLGIVHEDVLALAPEITLPVLADGRKAFLSLQLAYSVR